MYHKKEGHISIIGEPDCIGHAALKSGSASNIVEGIIDQISDQVFSNILAVGCDGTAVKNDPKSGTIKLLEEKFNDRCNGLFTYCICRSYPYGISLKN